MRLIINLIFLSLFVLALNYISCSRYSRKDLTLDQRYSLSEHTIKFLSSDLLQKRENPVKLIFAFKRTTENYTRMRALLEDYERYSDNKIDLECVDPIRSPNRARELANTYGIEASQIEFFQNMVIVDARPNVDKSLVQNPDDLNQAAYVRFLPGNSFVKYDYVSGNTPKAVALQMEDVVTEGLIGAVEGQPRYMYLVIDKSRLGREDRNDPTSLFATVDKLAREMNIQLVGIRISETQKIPEDAAGVMLIGPQYDLEPKEMEVLREYWGRSASSLFVMFDAAAGPLPNMFRFVREHGVYPRNDRILKLVPNQVIYETNAIFSPGSSFTQSFWNSSTLLEGQSSSLKVDEEDESLSIRRITAFPLLEAGSGYYGETKYDVPKPSYDTKEDYVGNLAIAAGVEQGSNDLNRARQTKRMTIITNMDMLSPQKVRYDQRDFLKSCLFWITDREELAGVGTRIDNTVKMSWDELTKQYIELCIVILLPLLALLIAFFLWRSRRA